MKHKNRFPGLLCLFRKYNSKYKTLIIKSLFKNKRIFSWGLLVLWLLVYLLSFRKASAQEIQPVQIGEKVPEITFSHLVNYKSQTAKLSDFKGKVVIIDFWDTWCKVCLEHMPEVTELKKRYGSKVQFIHLTSQSSLLVNQFLLHNTGIRNLDLTIAPGDKLGGKLFPYKIVPHVVWIDQQGVYLGSTSYVDVNKSVIDQILHTGSANFTEPKVDIISFDPDKPLFADGNGGTAKPLYKSLLTNYQPGLPSLEGREDTTSIERYYAVNLDLFTIYCHALSISPFSLTRPQIIYGDTLVERIFKLTKYGNQLAPRYCYELFYPKGKSQVANQCILQDLSKWFGLDVSLINQETDCYVLRQNHTVILKSTDSVRSNNLREPGNEIRFIKGQYLDVLIDYLNEQPGAKPVINETGYAGRVDLKLNRNPANIQELNQALAAYGLSLTQERRKLDMLTVSRTPPLKTN